MQIPKDIFKFHDPYKESGSPAKKFWLNIWTWWAGVTLISSFWWSGIYGLLDFGNTDTILGIINPLISITGIFTPFIIALQAYFDLSSGLLGIGGVILWKAWLVLVVFIISMILAHRIGKRIKDTILRIGFNLIILFALRILFILIVCGKIYSTFCQ